MAHLYASFADASLAEKAAGALLDYGVQKDDISLVAHEQHGTGWNERYSSSNTAAGVGRGVSNVGDSALDATKSVGDRMAQAGDRMAGAVTSAVGATGTAAGFQAAGDQRAFNADTRAGMAGSESAVHGSPASAGYATSGRSDLDAMDADDRTVNDHDSTDMSAKHGISTTTPQDAGEGAVKGTGIGLGLGILAGLASLLVPGVGLVVGGGALATALGGTALAAGAGAVAGGVTGYLKEQGVPGEAVQRYQGTIEQGGAVLSLNVPSGKVDQATAEQVLAKYGAGDVNSY